MKEGDMIVCSVCGENFNLNDEDIEDCVGLCPVCGEEIEIEEGEWDEVDALDAYTGGK